MLSECKFSHVSNVFDSKRKKQTKIPQSWSFKSQKKNEEHGKKMFQQRGWAGGLQSYWFTYLCHSMSDFLTIRIRVSEVALVCCCGKEPASQALCDLVRCNERGLSPLPNLFWHIWRESSTLTTSLMMLFLLQDPGVHLTSYAALFLSSVEQEENKRVSRVFQRLSSEAVRWSLVTG